jgi:anion-transporting  ArsA/GET3 family ATPase
MDKISFVGSKGGVGTSTVAALHALSVAGTGRDVRLTVTAAAGIEDLLAALIFMGDDRAVRSAWIAGREVWSAQPLK